MTAARAIATNGVKNHQMDEPALAKTKAPIKNNKLITQNITIFNIKHHHHHHINIVITPQTNWMMKLRPQLPRVEQNKQSLKPLPPTSKGGGTRGSFLASISASPPLKKYLNLNF